MKKALMYGAGNIGRGFIGKVFSESGYEVCFVDINAAVVEELNRKREYPIKIVSNAGQLDVTVKNVRAVNGREIEKVAQEIASADIIACAVGVKVLPEIVKPLALGLKKRFAAGSPPVNLIICENLIGADRFLRTLLEQELGADYADCLRDNLGLVEASIGRMVPVMTDDMREGELLKIWVEPYAELPVDKDAFVGEIPPLVGLKPFSPFGFYIKRKLFIHNLGHSTCAYVGWLKGYQYVYECVEDADIRNLAENTMRESAQALHREYGIRMQEITLHIQDLLARFDNRPLKDTVFRAGRDPLRKLGCNDRLTGAALYCLAHDIFPDHILTGIAAGLRYANPDDEGALELQTMVRELGIDGCIQHVCGLDKNSPLYRSLIQRYEEFGRTGAKG